MSKKILAIDADDTLFDENNAIRLFVNKAYGYNHTLEDYLVDGPFENYWERIWNLSPEETENIYEEFVESTYKKNLKPIKGALQNLKELNSYYDLVIVTARDERSVSFTHESLSIHYPNIFKNVYFAPLWGSDKKATKAEICSNIGAFCLVDDSFDHCRLAAEAGVHSILFGDYGWNRNITIPTGMKRCKNWDEVRRQCIQLLSNSSI